MYKVIKEKQYQLVGCKLYSGLLGNAPQDVLKYLYDIGHKYVRFEQNKSKKASKSKSTDEIE